MNKIQRKFQFELEGTSAILVHKFNGLDAEKKIKELAEKDQAEKHAYRKSNGNLGVPTSWVRGCLINLFIQQAGNKKKTSTKFYVSPRIQVKSEDNSELLDLNIEDYEIDVRSVPAGNMSRGGVRGFCVRPIIKEWTVKGYLLVSLDEETEKDLLRRFTEAGVDVGIGSNRINGFGRFKIVTFSKV